MNKLLTTLPSVGKDKKQLVHTQHSSVQAGVILKTPLFTPKAGKTSAPLNRVSRDVSSTFTKLEICQKEGFDYVQIKGERMNIAVDFKVWCGILLSLQKYGYNNDRITLPFTEFAALCGFQSKMFNQRLRDSMKASIERIASQRITMDKKGPKIKTLYTGLVLKAYLDEVEDEVFIQADPSLWELYLIDHQILISQNVIKKLPRAETAQCLYLYFASLPNNPAPVSFQRLRDRLQLTATMRETNRTITNALNKLVAIGYLQGEIRVNKKGVREFVIFKRCQKMLLNTKD